MRWLIGAAVTVLVLSLATMAAAGTLDAASIQEHTLPNGLQVLIKESHAAEVVALQYWVRAGSYTDTAESAGIAHFIEHLWFKGTARRPAGNVDQEIEDLGSVLEAVTDKDWSLVKTTVASQFVGKALDVIADVVQHPRFQPADIDTERRVILDEIATARSDPLRFLVSRLFASAFRTHPYRFEVTGSPESVLRLKPPQIRDYFARNYSLSNGILVIVGDVQPAEILRQVRTLFSAPGPPVPRPAVPPAETMPLTQPRRDVLETPFRGGYYGVAFPAPGIVPREDVYAHDVLVTLLGQGSWGRLPAALGEEATVVRAGYQTLRQPGLLTISVQTSPEKLDRVEQLVSEELRKLRETLASPAELEGTRRILTGMYAIDNETFADQAHTLGYYAAIDRWDFACSYLDNVRKVTAEQVRQAATRYLMPEHSVTVLLRPRAEKGEGS
jgi:zinc protease